MRAATRLKKRLIASLIGASVVAVGAMPMIAGAQASNASLRGSAPSNTQITAFSPATTVSQHMINTRPQVSQNLLEFADIVPGMIFEVQGDGNTLLHQGAHLTNGVNVYIDGADQNVSQGNPFDARVRRQPAGDVIACRCVLHRRQRAE